MSWVPSGHGATTGARTRRKFRRHNGCVQQWMQWTSSTGFGGPFRSFALRSLVGAGAALILSVVLSPPAMAHSDEVSADPPADSVLQVMPEQVIVTFNEPLLEAGAALVVTADTGQVVSVEPAVVQDRSIQAAISGGGPGTYQVAYRVVSGDGHPVTGTYAFTVSAPTGQSVEPEPQASPATGSGGDGSSANETGLTLISVTVLAILLVAAVLGILAWKRRRT